MWGLRRGDRARTISGLLEKIRFGLPDRHLYQEAVRIDRRLTQPDFVMQMRRGYSARSAYSANLLGLPDLLAHDPRTEPA